MNHIWDSWEESVYELHEFDYELFACPECSGEGWLVIENKDGTFRLSKCYSCNGTGEFAELIGVHIEENEYVYA